MHYGQAMGYVGWVRWVGWEQRGQRMHRKTDKRLDVKVGSGRVRRRELLAVKSCVQRRRTDLCTM